MIVHALVVAHIAVLGYWLGSELVINSTYRHVSFAASMPFAERDRLMDHVMDVDQHVRYALVLQAGLGTMLAALLGYLPGGGRLAVGAALFAAGWLALVELTHRLRKQPVGRVLAALDNGVRYAAMLAVLGVTAVSMTGGLILPGWLAWKLVLFAGVIACGLGIRLALVRFYAVWREIESRGSTPAREQNVRRAYWHATSVLAFLWLLIGGIVVLSVGRF